MRPKIIWPKKKNIINNSYILSFKCICMVIPTGKQGHIKGSLLNNSCVLF